MSETYVYRYRGPVYDAWEKFIENTDQTTEAVSKIKAATNIEYRLRQKLGRPIHVDRNDRYWAVKPIKLIERR